MLDPLPATLSTEGRVPVLKAGTAQRHFGFRNSAAAWARCPCHDTESGRGKYAALAELSDYYYQASVRLVDIDWYIW
jgi:hypothetical protein